MNTATKLPEPKPPRIKAVSGFQTTDGQLFNTSREAEEHQNYLDFYDWCMSSVDDTMSRAEIAEAIWADFNVTPRENAV